MGEQIAIRNSGESSSEPLSEGLRMYLDQMGRVALPDIAETVQSFCELDKLRIAATELEPGEACRDSTRDRGYTEAEQRVFLAEQKIASQHLRLVVHIANRMPSSEALDIEDVIQFGNIGLLQAVRGYDPAKDTDFSTYASVCISNSIMSGTNENGLRGEGAVRIPLDARRALMNYEQQESDCGLLRFDTTPVAEIAKRLDRTEAEVVKYREMSALTRVASLTGLPDHALEMELREEIDDVEDIEGLIAQIFDAANVTEKQRYFISLRYGIPCEEYADRTLNAVRSDGQEVEIRYAEYIEKYEEFIGREGLVTNSDLARMLGVHADYVQRTVKQGEQRVREALHIPEQKVD